MKSTSSGGSEKSEKNVNEAKRRFKRHREGRSWDEALASTGVF